MSGVRRRERAINSASLDADLVGVALRELAEGYSSAKRLHAGAQSEVYSALRARDGREVVLKLYKGRPAERRWTTTWRGSCWRGFRNRSAASTRSPSSSTSI